MRDLTGQRLKIVVFPFPLSFSSLLPFSFIVYFVLSSLFLPPEDFPIMEGRCGELEMHPSGVQVSWSKHGRVSRKRC